ncbi:MAG: Lrp/AsnC family transcriptional regulator [Anaerolineales bacterium]|nr:Lrp/AsnC family transcriptional regulator [Anaerolineales bacterium]
MKQYSDLDDVDVQILDQLQTDSSISNVKLSELVNLSPPSVHSRIKRLQQLGYITGYTALLDREKLGFEMTFFIQVSVRNHSSRDAEQFKQQIIAMPKVLECHHVTGEFDYMLKVVVRNKQELQMFLLDRLTTIDGIERVQTSMSVMELKATHHLPIRD